MRTMSIYRIEIDVICRYIYIYIVLYTMIYKRICVVMFLYIYTRCLNQCFDVGRQLLYTYAHTTPLEYDLIDDK